GDMCQGWPDGVSTEIKVSQLTNHQCEIPVAELTAGMKAGKTKYPWKQIRSWMKSGHAAPSAHGEVLLEMPLKVIANLLLSQQQPSFKTAPAPAPAPVQAQAPAPVPVPAAAPAPIPMPAGIPLTKRQVDLPDLDGIPDMFAPPPKAAPAAAAAVPAPTVPAPVIPAPAIPAPMIPAPSIPAPIAATPAVAAPAKSSGNTKFKGNTQFARRETISIPLATVSGAWPETLRKEIETLGLSDSVLGVPVEVLETALKTGKVAFFWKQVCQWLDACPPDAFASSFADVTLEWPLGVIAPMFLQSRPAKTPKSKGPKIDIPDVFNSAKGGAAAPAQAEEPEPEEKAVAAPAPVQEVAEPAAPKRMPKDLAELFGEPEKRNWTPNEIVHKTCTLPGLDGALIALQDGLLVAACMPPAWKSETISAFLPQIFGRMHQYTRELKMGELMSVGFTVEQGTLQIFNAGIIYFAALCKQGETLPAAELNLIARELSRHTK
ncbi:MAG TPA: hypothetical protein VMZ27_17995, partial [Candidatus Saccharimonadales bacterium]|nr:hypothetical protein [Candidatus Saccharimonadales bacterium]